MEKPENACPKIVIACIILMLAPGCQRKTYSVKPTPAAPKQAVLKQLPANAPPQLKKLIDSAVAQVGVTTGYDPSYVKLDYPAGDVPINTGVCSDVIVRAFREAGVDLQKEVHEDMTRAWSAYPKKWGLNRADRNIDHRRVPNLMTYFNRQAGSLSITQIADDYLPGDVIAWDLGGDIDHIGIVTNMWSESGKRFMIAHNIGAGAQVEDVMFDWTITGHYRYFK